MDGDPKPLTRNDYFALAAFCLVFYGLFAIDPQPFCIHETVHCQNIREMIADGDWTLAHYGGRPWLERPPLPYWVSIPFILILGPADWVYLVPTILLGTGIVCVVASMAALFFGRRTGLLSGFILATTQEFQKYACGAESDIFLCFIVTAALALFAKIEFGHSDADADRRFFGRRGWLVLAMFAVIGLTNLAKGLAFGTCVACAPIVAYLLLAKRSSISRYMWFWGWAAFAAVALPWPLNVLRQYPDAIDFWFNDYLERQFVVEPTHPWYYLVQLPWMLVPWTLCSAIGVCLLWPKRDAKDKAARAFVLAWALAPLIGLSLSRHKHHHYLLHAVAPWSMYAAAGAVWGWERFKSAPALLRQPLVGGALLYVPAAIALYLFRAKVPGPAWVVPCLAAIVAVSAVVAWIGITRRSGAWAFGLVVAVAAFLQLGIDYYETLYMDNYEHDIVFLRQSCATVPPKSVLLVNAEDGALTASWWMHYSKDRIQMIHNPSFLRDSRIAAKDVYLIGRRHIADDLKAYGTVEIVLDCPRSRAQGYPGDVQTLYHIRFFPDLAKTPGDIRYTPLQATTRAPGPFLTVSSSGNKDH